VPQLGHAGLSKGEHGPDDLQCREEVGCSWDQWPGSGRMLTIGVWHVYLLRALIGFFEAPSFGGTHLICKFEGSQRTCCLASCP
jgi:hypothetical protein